MHGLFLLEEGLGYGLVVPFPAYGFASLVSHNESLNSLNSSPVWNARRNCAYNVVNTNV